MVVLVLGFGANIVVSRALGPVGFGHLAILSTVVVLASSAAGASVGWGVLQWGVEAWSRGDQRQAATLLGRSGGWHALVQLPITVAVGVLLLQRAGPLVIATFAVVTMVSTLLGSATIALSVSQRTAAGAKIGMVASTVSQLAGVAVALTAPTASGVWVARYVAGTIGPLAALPLLDPILRRAVLHPRLPRHMPSGFWRFALQYTGSGLLGLLVFNRSEILVLELYGRDHAVGLYALAYGLATHLIAPVDAAMMPLVVGLGSLLATSPTLVGRGLLRAERLVALVSGVLVAVIIPALVLTIPLIYGHEYQGAGMLVLVLALVATLRALKHPVAALLNARRRSGVLLSANLASFAVDAAIAFSAITVIGVWGAVAATGASQVVAMVLEVHGETKHGVLTWAEFVYSCRSWVVGVACGAVSLGVGILLAGDCTRIGAAVVTVVVSVVLLVLVTRVAGPVLHDGDGTPVVSALPLPLRRPVAKIFRWCGDDGGIGATSGG